MKSIVNCGSLFSTEELLKEAKKVNKAKASEYNYAKVTKSCLQYSRKGGKK